MLLDHCELCTSLIRETMVCPKEQWLHLLLERLEGKPLRAVLSKYHEKTGWRISKPNLNRKRVLWVWGAVLGSTWCRSLRIQNARGRCRRIECIVVPRILRGAGNPHIQCRRAAHVAEKRQVGCCIDIADVASWAVELPQEATAVKRSDVCYAHGATCGKLCELSYVV